MIRLDAGVKGTGLSIYVQMLARAYGVASTAAQMAKANYPGFPAVAESLVRMTAIPAADTVTPGWASELAAYGLAEDFIQAVRPRTVIDRLNQVRRFPFLTNVPVESGPAVGAWVGAGQPIPVGRSTFTNVALQPFLAGVITVLTRELIDSTQPSAIPAIRESLVRGVVAYLDAQFLDPSVAAVADVSPGSITNGATQVSSTGTTAVAMITDLMSMLDAADDLVNPVWIMNAKTCANIAGTTLLPGVAVVNGTLLGIPILCTKSSPAPVGSPAMPRLLTLIDQDAVLLADDGEADVAVSTATALQQQSAPTAGAQNTISLFQTHAAAIRVTRRMSWKRSRATGVIFAEVNY